MRIIIAGCGQIGESLAVQLSNEGHDLVLLDNDIQNINKLTTKLDALTIHGNCASAATLREAEIKNADLLIVTTGSDEQNLLSCMTARALNKKIHTIARIRDPEYIDQAYEMREAFGLSLQFNPEKHTAVEIERLLKYPGFLKRDAFADNRAEIVEIKIERDSKLNDVAISGMTRIVGCNVLVCTVLRDGKAIIPYGNLVLHENDRIFVTAQTETLTTLMKNLGLVSKRARKIIIIGGGMDSYYLAQSLLKSRMEVTIIEKDEERAKEISELLDGKINVIAANGSDKDILDNEGIDNCGAVVSLTGNDEKNIILSMYAHEKGVPQIITKLGEFEDTNLIDNLPIGAVVSPRSLCSNTVLRYVRAMQRNNGAALSIHSIADGQSEALEFEIKDKKYCGISLRNMKLRKDVVIACICHADTITIPNGESCLSIGDTIVAIAARERSIVDFDDLFS